MESADRDHPEGRPSLPQSYAVQGQLPRSLLDFSVLFGHLRQVGAALLLLTAALDC